MAQCRIMIIEDETLAYRDLQAASYTRAVAHRPPSATTQSHSNRRPPPEPT